MEVGTKAMKKKGKRWKGYGWELGRGAFKDCHGYSMMVAYHMPASFRINFFFI